MSAGASVVTTTYRLLKLRVSGSITIFVVSLVSETVAVTGIGTGAPSIYWKTATALGLIAFRKGLSKSITTAAVSFGCVTPVVLISNTK